MSARHSMSPKKASPFTSPERARNGGLPTIDEVPGCDAPTKPQHSGGVTVASSFPRSCGESQSPPTDQGSASSSITTVGGHVAGAGMSYGGCVPVPPAQSISKDSSRRPSIGSQGVARTIYESPLRQPRGPSAAHGSSPAFRRMSTSSSPIAKMSPISQASNSASAPADFQSSAPSGLQRRDSTASHMSGGSVFESPARHQLSGLLQTMKVGEPPKGVTFGVTEPHFSQTLRDVPEELTVHEFAFRQGQHDRGDARERIPTSPFDPSFDREWKSSYMIGKYSKGLVKGPPPNGSSASGTNFEWAPLVNVYTQDLEHPNGSYDGVWVRDQCLSALDAMEARIRVILERGQQWERVVTDVPRPIAQAIAGFGDLSNRYEQLQRDAAAAKEHVSASRRSNRYNTHRNNPNYYSPGGVFF